MSGRGTPAPVLAPRRSKRGRIPKATTAETESRKKARRSSSGRSQATHQVPSNPTPVSPTFPQNSNIENGSSLLAEANLLQSDNTASYSAANQTHSVATSQQDTERENHRLVMQRIEQLCKIQETHSEILMQLATAVANGNQLSQPPLATSAPPRATSAPPTVTLATPTATPAPTTQDDGANEAAVTINHSLFDAGPSQDLNLRLQPSTNAAMAAKTERQSWDDIPPKMVIKIRQMEYVNFKELFASTLTQSDSSANENVEEGENEEVWVKGKKYKPASTKKVSTLTFKEWFKMWHKFVMIRLQNQNNATMSAKFAKHFANVEELYEKGFSWYYYDKMARKDYAKVEPFAEWGRIIEEHWLKAMTKSVKPVSKMNRPPHRGAPFGKSGQKSRPFVFVPRGFCIDFHMGKKCLRKNCQYKHDCFRCYKGKHQALNCNFFRAGKQNTMPNNPNPKSS